jgi:Rrf2 family protein
MRISRQGEYGLAAILYLASQPEGKLSLRDEIARRCGIPRDFLAQILARLRRGGILGSRRGARGGYFLRVEPHRLSLADVLEALEGNIRLLRPVDDLAIEAALPEVEAPAAAGEGALQTLIGVRREAFRRLQERGYELLRSIKIGELLSVKSGQA